MFADVCVCVWCGVVWVGGCEGVRMCECARRMCAREDGARDSDGGVVEQREAGAA